MAPISILLVDDDPIFRRVATQFLNECHGDEVTVIATFDQGKEASNQVEALRPDVVLVDLTLPDQSGLEVITNLRAVWPHISIIALNQLSYDGYRQASLEAGADAFVAKATLSTELLSAIRRVRRCKEPQGSVTPELGRA